ncbi:2,3,4,5-tetrahydropyridine-2,6-dicarboxylate N-acetyltransferase (plasmid) [Asticcacaulis sp. MM231]|uniref:acyltransferase n=1 Tax=Asticcacaulis sp. MM231 TaxID=3157666 RepID=UPI0032D579D4
MSEQLFSAIDPKIVSEFGPKINTRTLARCRDEIESNLKRTLRFILVMVVKIKLGIRGVGEGFQCGPNVFIKGASTVVGRYVYLGGGFECAGPLVVGDMCMVSTHVKVVGNDHKIYVLGGATRLEFNRTAPVTIFESDCWIGKQVIIRQGVRIGRGAVVGAGSIVTKDVPPYAVVAGNPARLLKMRFTADEIIQHDEVLYAE